MNLYAILFLLFYVVIPLTIIYFTAFYFFRHNTKKRKSWVALGINLGFVISYAYLILNIYIRSILHLDCSEFCSVPNALIGLYLLPFHALFIILYLILIVFEKVRSMGK